ncbi:MAG TPA: hypothetical protein VFS43_06095 [Polyangiaceae bacterium]|nr:hypothetical protein [Polyangiaceae bacterium]
MSLQSIWQRGVAWLRARPPWGWALAAGALTALGLALHAQRYPTFFFDDSFISLRYADRFRSGLGLTWTDGERVEGYTNFLWVVVVGVIGLFKRSLISPARVLGVVCMTLAAVAAAYGQRVRRPREFVAAAFPGLALASLGPVAAWSVGGLEHPMLMALLVWAIVLLQPAAEGETPSRRTLVTAGVLLGLASLTRPDGILLAGMACGGVVLARAFRAPGWRAAGVAGGVALAFTGAHLLFRRAYYGAWAPNTSSKLGFGAERFQAGLAYLGEGARLWVALFAVAAFALLLGLSDGRVRRRALPVLLPLVAWCLYVAAVGGDFMPQRRHVVPALVLLCVLGAEAFSWMARHGAAAAALGWAGAALVVGHLWYAQRKDWAIADANNTGWYWAARPIGRFFQASFGSRDPLLAVDAAGALPYFSRLRALDMLGLNDRWIAQHPPPGARGLVGHHLGDGAYVLSRKPDLVVFHLPYGSKDAMWLSGKQMQASPEWRRLYQLVHYETPEGTRGVVWARRDDGRIGIERPACQVLVPGYLLASHAETPATFEGEGIGTRVPAGREVKLTSVPVPEGIWRLEVNATGQVDATVQLLEGGKIAAGAAASPVTVPGRANGLNVQLRAPGGAGAPAAHVRALRFYRVDEAGRALEPSDPRCAAGPPPRGA